MAMETDKTQERWVNLGNVSAAGITIPDTCGPQGAAGTFWVKLLPGSDYGFLTSQSGYSSSGFQFYGGIG